MFFGVLVPSLVTLITPFACSTLTGLIACRVFTGLLEGVTYPTVHALLARWAPTPEKSRIVGIVWAGAYLGTALTLPLAGTLVKDDGWESVFFVIGGMGIAWSAAWLLFGASSPEELTRTSSEERDYISASRGVAAAEGPVPWLQLACSPAAWAVFLQHTVRRRQLRRCAGRGGGRLACARGATCAVLGIMLCNPSSFSLTTPLADA